MSARLPACLPAAAVLPARWCWVTPDAALPAPTHQAASSGLLQDHFDHIPVCDLLQGQGPANTPAMGTHICDGKGIMPRQGDVDIKSRYAAFRVCKQAAMATTLQDRQGTVYT